MEHPDLSFPARQTTELIRSVLALAIETHEHSVTMAPLPFVSFEGWKIALDSTCLWRAKKRSICGPIELCCLCL